jgi:N-acetylglucosaminyldiphosphoundecaprenol N-acetyl-beta-D-mannosaminyltransferase
MTAPTAERVNVLGVGISAIDMAQALDTIEGWIGKREPHYVCVTPAHGVMDCRADPELARIFNCSGLTTPDGMSIVWLLRLRGHRGVQRVYGPDLVNAVCERSLAHGWRHFFYGGEKGVADELACRLRSRFAGLEVVGTYCPPFRPLSPEEDREVAATITLARPDIVWVGISTPKKERWMAAHVNRLGVPVLIGVGAAFDFLSGRKRQAPRWLQRCGGEWLFRLANEPARLWRRYARYPVFVALAGAQALGLRRYEMR